MSKLLLIRHAQASLLSDDYDNLSEKGLQQSRLLGDYFIQKKYAFDKVYIGPLRRHRQTYQEVQAIYQANNFPLPTPIEIDELDEHRSMDTMKDMEDLLSIHHPTFNKWQVEMATKPTPKLRMKMVDTFLNMWARDSFGFELPAGSQRFPDFNSQAKKGLDLVMQGNEQGKSIAVFSSGGCIGAMLGKVLGMDDPVKIMGLNLVMVNAALSEVLFSGSRLSMKSFNLTPHLPEEMVTTM